MTDSYRDGFKYVNGRRIDPAVEVEQLSSNQRTLYTATRWADGTTSCNCPGWAMRKTCKHAKLVARATESVRLSNNAPDLPQATVVPTPTRTTANRVLRY